MTLGVLDRFWGCTGSCLVVLGQYAAVGLALGQDRAHICIMKLSKRRLGTHMFTYICALLIPLQNTSLETVKQKRSNKDH